MTIGGNGARSGLSAKVYVVTFAVPVTLSPVHKGGVTEDRSRSGANPSPATAVIVPPEPVASARVSASSVHGAPMLQAVSFTAGDARSQTIVMKTQSGDVGTSGGASCVVPATPVMSTAKLLIGFDGSSPSRTMRQAD